jgi:site-specific DNA-cytosine methylase
MNSSPTYIDLFAGAGGLSEGFIKAGFNPIAHVEMSKEACDTLKTRLALSQPKQKFKPLFLLSTKRNFQGRTLENYSFRNN